MDFNDDLIACASLVEKGDPVRFRTVMAAPVPARGRLFALYAFNVEVARAPWLTQEPMIAEMRLQWWRDALEEIATDATPRRHQVVTPLQDVLSSPCAEMLDELVAARRWDIYKDAFEDAAHFERYIDQTSGHLMVAAARALGGADEQVVRDAAFASGCGGVVACDPCACRGQTYSTARRAGRGDQSACATGIEASGARPRAAFCRVQSRRASDVACIASRPCFAHGHQTPRMGGRGAA